MAKDQYVFAEDAVAAGEDAPLLREQEPSKKQKCYSCCKEITIWAILVSNVILLIVLVSCIRAVNNMVTPITNSANSFLQKTGAQAQLDQLNQVLDQVPEAERTPQRVLEQLVKNHPNNFLAQQAYQVLQENGNKIDYQFLKAMAKLQGVDVDDIEGKFDAFAMEVLEFGKDWVNAQGGLDEILAKLKAFAEENAAQVMNQGRQNAHAFMNDAAEQAAQAAASGAANGAVAGAREAFMADGEAAAQRFMAQPPRSFMANAQAGATRVAAATYADDDGEDGEAE